MRAPHIIAPTIAFAVLIATVSWGWVSESAMCTGSDEHAMCWRGTVTGVIDGDTLDVNNTRIRLSLVDAPERGEPAYAAATTHLGTICATGTTALVDVDDTQDKSHGRTVAAVYCGSLNANAEMINSDYATVYGKFCGMSEFPAAWLDSEDESARWAHDACSARDAGT